MSDRQSSGSSIRRRETGCSPQQNACPFFFYGEIQLIDAGTGVKVRAFRQAGGGPLRLAFSQDSSRLASANQTDDATTLWNPATGEELRTLDGPPTGIDCLAFTENDDALIAVGRNIVRTWSAKVRQRTYRFVGHDCPVKSSAINREGTRIVSRSEDGTVKLWATVMAQELWTHKLNFSDVAFVAFDPTERQVVVQSNHQQVALLDVQSGDTLPNDATLNAIESELVRDNEDWQLHPSGNEVYVTDLRFYQRP